MKQQAGEILKQLRALTEQMEASAYAAPLDLLESNTVGKHVRHILEFFDMLFSGAQEGTINYDNRRHDTLYETNPAAAAEKIAQLIEGLDDLEEHEPVLLKVNFNEEESMDETAQSSVGRELAYNVEHAIHHMAIIRIAVKSAFPGISLPDNFGLAYSTIRYHSHGDDA